MPATGESRDAEAQKHHTITRWYFHGATKTLDMLPTSSTVSSRDAPLMSENYAAVEAAQGATHLPKGH